MANFIKKLFRGKSQDVQTVVEPEAPAQAASMRYTDIVLTAPETFGFVATFSFQTTSYCLLLSPFMYV